MVLTRTDVAYQTTSSGRAPRLGMYLRNETSKTTNAFLITANHLIAAAVVGFIQALNSPALKVFGESNQPNYQSFAKASIIMQDHQNKDAEPNDGFYRLE